MLPLTSTTIVISQHPTRRCAVSRGPQDHHEDAEQQNRTAPARVPADGAIIDQPRRPPLHVRCNRLMTPCKNQHQPNSQPTDADARPVARLYLRCHAMPAATVTLQQQKADNHHQVYNIPGREQKITFVRSPTAQVAIDDVQVKAESNAHRSTIIVYFHCRVTIYTDGDDDYPIVTACHAYGALYSCGSSVVAAAVADKTALACPRIIHQVVPSPTRMYEHAHECYAEHRSFRKVLRVRVQKDGNA